MTISKSILLTLQHAGESVHAAKQVFAQAVQSSATRVVSAVASEPFSAEADKSYSQLRAIARLAHEIQSIEEQLKTIYETATKIAGEDTPVLTALPSHIARHSPGANVEDAVEKQPKKSSTSASKRLSANDQKVLAFMKTVLDRRSWKPVSHSDISKGAGIPPGSISLSMRRVVESGAVHEGAKGHYRLA